MPAVGVAADCAVSVFSGKQHYNDLRHSVIDSAGLQPALWTTEANAAF